MNRYVRTPTWGTVPQALNGLPAVLHVHDPDLNATADWIADHRDEILAKQLEAGAILIRGADAGTPERFERIVRLLEPDLKNDYLGTSPRDALTDHVFEASGLPGFYPIPQHCEMTFVANPPSKLFFGCTVAPREHGETPLVDFRTVWRELRPDVRDRFEQGGIRIVRNYAAPGAAGGLWQLKPWNEMFGTTDRDVVTARSEAEGFQVSWHGDGALRLVSEHDASRKHPVTGEPVWFNHVQVFHLSAGPGEYKRIFQLRPSARALAVWQMAAWSVRFKQLTADPDSHPMHCTYRDGSEIPDADMEHLRDVIWANMVRVPWHKGDIVAIDNFSVSHGRMPYQGPRTIVVAWS